MSLFLLPVVPASHFSGIRRNVNFGDAHLGYTGEVPTRFRLRSGFLVGIYTNAGIAPGLAVTAGALIEQYVDTRYLSYAAGAGFIIIGIWTIVQAFGE
jgi:cytochrome c biogenesis protein CcdA